MKKKLTLDETWRLCLSMWRWIAEQVKNGNEEGVVALKAKWTSENGFGYEIDGNCFFCHFAKGCYDCPGGKVDPDFDCCNIDYSYASKPIAFYEKLRFLNRKRLKGKL